MLSFFVSYDDFIDIFGAYHNPRRPPAPRSPSGAVSLSDERERGRRMDLRGAGFRDELDFYKYNSIYFPALFQIPGNHYVSKPEAPLPLAPPAAPSVCR